MSNSLHLYRMMPYQNADWQILVVAHSAKEAKRLGWPVLRYTNPADIPEYLKCWVQLERCVAVPNDVIEPVVIENCDDAQWTCVAWSYEQCPHTCPRFKSEREGVSDGPTD